MKKDMALTKNVLKTGIIPVISLLLLFACVDESRNNGIGEGGTAISFPFTRSSQDIVNNTQVYQFHPSWEFKQKIFAVTPGADMVTVQSEVGTWNFALVSAETPFATGIIPPVNGAARTGKMWETAPVAGVLPSMPELRTAWIDNQTVVANTTVTASQQAILARNVAMVKVVIDKARGLDPAAADHHFSLNKAPVAINWAGGLYPDKTNPDISGAPMKGDFIVSNSAEPGIQQSDTLRFIIPAHKGSDYLGANPQDTTTHLMTLDVDLACLGGTRLQRTDIPILRTPRANGILVVKLTLLGEMEVDAEVLGWTDEEVPASINQTQLLVNKANVGLAYRDTIYVNTNAGDFTFTVDAGASSWLTAQRIGTSNAIALTADIGTYVDNSPRFTFIDIKANNVTKRIPVTQRPERGTIKADQNRLVFCPVSHVTRAVQVNSIGGNWILLAQSDKATANLINGSAGTTGVTFTRRSTTNFNDFDTYYGDGMVVVKNTTTLDTDTIRLINCYIDIPNNTINAVAPTGTNQTAVTVSEDVTVYGGNKGLVFDTWSNWIHNGIVWDASQQKMTFTTDREPDDEARDGTMIFHHAECPDYVITATVHQDIIVTIPPFDYFVVKFTWGSGDVDIAVEFAGNHLSGNGTNNGIYDKLPMGWSMQNRGSVTSPLVTSITGSGGGIGDGREQLLYKSNKLLEWGGDATGGQGETVIFYAPSIENDENSPRRIILEVYSTWYSDQAGQPMNFSFTAYKGGSMSRGPVAGVTGSNAYNFYNSGGELLYAVDRTVIIPTRQGASNYATGGYTHVTTITYDRIKHSATYVVHAAAGSPGRGLSNENVSILQRSPEEEIEYNRIKNATNN